MQCHSTSIKSHQLKLSVSPITRSDVEEISETSCLIDACVVCLTDQEKPRKTVTKPSRISGQMTLVPIWPC